MKAEIKIDKAEERREIAKWKKEQKESGANPLIDFKPNLKKPGTDNTF